MDTTDIPFELSDFNYNQTLEEWMESVFKSTLMIVPLCPNALNALNALNAPTGHKGI